MTLQTMALPGDDPVGPYAAARTIRSTLEIALAPPTVFQWRSRRQRADRMRTRAVCRICLYSAGADSSIDPNSRQSRRALFGDWDWTRSPYPSIGRLFFRPAGWQRRRSGHFPARRFTALVSVVAVPEAPLKLWWVTTPYPRLRCLVIPRLPFREHRTPGKHRALQSPRLQKGSGKCGNPLRCRFYRCLCSAVAGCLRL